MRSTTESRTDTIGEIIAVALPYPLDQLLMSMPAAELETCSPEPRYSVPETIARAWGGHWELAQRGRVHADDIQSQSCCALRMEANGSGSSPNRKSQRSTRIRPNESTNRSLAVPAPYLRAPQYDAQVLRRAWFVIFGGSRLCEIVCPIIAAQGYVSKIGQVNQSQRSSRDSRGTVGANRDYAHRAIKRRYL